MDQDRHEAELVMLPLTCHRELKIPGLDELLHRWVLQTHWGKLKAGSVTLESNVSVQLYQSLSFSSVSEP